MRRKPVNPLMKYFSILGIVGLLLLSSCITFKEVKFEGVDNVSFGKVKQGIIPLILDLKIDNPNSFSIKLKKGEVDVFINNQFLGKSSLSDKIIIKKEKLGVYPLVINTSFSALTKAALSSFGALLGKEVVLKVDGKIIVKALVIRKKIEVNFSEPIDPSLLLNM
tara:strand:+ start:1725 stop:2219 length:495 start_codon:yes stop_codon:yes gene_type:complete